MFLLYSSDFRKIFKEIESLMKENKDYLCKLDGALGDGDIGVTMCTGFYHINIALEATPINDIGELFIKSGFVISDKAPSTMGTLLGSGFLNAGANMRGVTEIDLEGLFQLFSHVSEGIIKRGKAKLGDKTILDSLIPAIKVLEVGSESSSKMNLKEGITKAYRAAEEGMKNTIDMKSSKGRGARYLENSKGKQDPGATVCKLIFEGFCRYINNVED